nr:MAG TPA: hypothetical protein [Bacteriophage sp.]
MFEEAGSNPTLLKSFIQGEALVDVGGNKLGILCAGGSRINMPPKIEQKR